MVGNTLNQQTKLRMVSILLVLSYLGVFLGIYFLSKWTSNITISRIKAAETQRDITLADKILIDKSRNQSQLNKVMGTLPSKYFEVSFFTRELERLAQNNGLTIRINADPKKKEEKESFNSINYSLEMTGPYSAASAFLDQMSKLPFHTSIDFLNIETKDEQLLTQVKFRLFIQK